MRVQLVLASRCLIRYIFVRTGGEGGEGEDGEGEGEGERRVNEEGEGEGEGEGERTLIYCENERRDVNNTRMIGAATTNKTQTATGETETTRGKGGRGRGSVPPVRANRARERRR